MKGDLILQGDENLCVQHCVVQVFVCMNVITDMLMTSPGKSCLGDQKRLQNLYAVPTLSPLPEVSKFVQDQAYFQRFQVHEKTL